MALARDGRSEARASRRANAIVLLNDGWSCGEVAAALLMDDDTVRGWSKLYEEHGLTGLVVFGHGGSDSHLTQRKASGTRRMGSSPSAAPRGHDRRVDQSDAWRRI